MKILRLLCPIIFIVYGQAQASDLVSVEWTEVIESLRRMENSSSSIENSSPPIFFEQAPRPTRMTRQPVRHINTQSFNFYDAIIALQQNDIVFRMNRLEDETELAFMQLLHDRINNIAMPLDPQGLIRPDDDKLKYAASRILEILQLQARNSHYSSLRAVERSQSARIVIRMARDISQEFS